MIVSGDVFRDVGGGMKSIDDEVFYGLAKILNRQEELYVAGYWGPYPMHTGKAVFRSVSRDGGENFIYMSDCGSESLPFPDGDEKKGLLVAEKLIRDRLRVWQVIDVIGDDRWSLPNGWVDISDVWQEILPE